MTQHQLHVSPLRRATYDVIELPTRANPEHVSQAAAVGFAPDSGGVHLTLTEQAAEVLAVLVLQRLGDRDCDIQADDVDVDEHPWREIAADLLGARAVARAHHTTSPCGTAAAHT